MKVTTCDLQGLLIIEPDVFGDNRGYFMESWNRQRYRDAGLDFDFVQDNFSLSHRGTLRGLHFQNPLAQGKLVSVLQGEVFDVGGDISLYMSTRVYSTFFGATFIPATFGHHD